MGYRCGARVRVACYRLHYPLVAQGTRTRTWNALLAADNEQPLRPVPLFSCCTDVGCGPGCPAYGHFPRSGEGWIRTIDNRLRFDPCLDCDSDVDCRAAVGLHYEGKRTAPLRPEPAINPGGATPHLGVGAAAHRGRKDRSDVLWRRNEEGLEPSPPGAPTGFTQELRTVLSTVQFVSSFHCKSLGLTPAWSF